MMIAPFKSRWVIRCVLVALLLAALWVAARELGLGKTHRIDDRAALLDPTEVPKFEAYLDQLHDESGADIRFLLVDSVPGGSLEEFAVQQARALGIGRDLDRRGVLFAYDVKRRRLRIEVGPTLQGIFTDRFVGYLMRDHVRSFFAAGNPSLGLRLTLFMLHARLRRATLGEEYDPRAADYIEDRRKLAAGGGASASMAAAGERADFVNTEATVDARRYFAPQPTVEQAYHRYLEWLREGRFQANVDLFTKPSQAYLATLPATPAFVEYVLFVEYGRAYRVLVRGDLALLFFTDDPLPSPHFFRRTGSGWQMDLAAEVRDTRNLSGWPWTWGLLEQDDDFTRAFFDRYIVVGPILRPAGADNRPLPMHAADVPRWASQPGAADPPGVEQLTVTEAAERIAAVHGRPTVVLFYSTWNEATEKAFPAMVAFLRRSQVEGAEVLAFSTDENWNAVNQLADFLRAHNAPFPATHLYRWPPGQLTRAMAPLGIRIEASWLPPLVAVRDGDGRVIAQAEGIVSRGPDLDIAEVETAMRELARRPGRSGVEGGSPSH